MIPYVAIYDFEGVARAVAYKLAAEGFDDYQALLSAEIFSSNKPAQDPAPVAAAPALESAAPAGPDGDREVAADEAPAMTTGAPVAPLTEEASVVDSPADGPAKLDIAPAAEKVMTPDGMEKLKAAVDKGLIPSGSMAECINHLKEGRSIVAVCAGFGRGKLAVDILTERGALMDLALGDEPSPLSDILECPTLSNYEPSTQLVDPTWKFSSMFGLALTGGGPAPLSSAIGFDPLSKNQTGWESSMGMPLLNEDPAPLSGLCGLETVTPPKPDWTHSMGFPLLSENGTVLSSLFGLPTLLGED